MNYYFVILFAHKNYSCLAFNSPSISFLQEFFPFKLFSIGKCFIIFFIFLAELFGRVSLMPVAYLFFEDLFLLDHWYLLVSVMATLPETYCGSWLTVYKWGFLCPQCLLAHKNQFLVYHLGFSYEVIAILCYVLSCIGIWRLFAFLPIAFIICFFFFFGVFVL